MKDMIKQFFLDLLQSFPVSLNTLDDPIFNINIGVSAPDCFLSLRTGSQSILQSL